MHKIKSISPMLAVALSTAAFASGEAAPVAGSAKPAPKRGGAPKADERVAIAFTGVSTSIPRPVKQTSNVLAEKLAALEVDQSIGISNKSKKQIASMLSKVNGAADNVRQVVDANGIPQFEVSAPVTDANGAIVTPGKQTPKTEKVRFYEAHDVDPKTDADKASVRIWRVK